MDYKNFIQSATFKKILYGLGVLFVALFVFQAGMFAGYQKASFSYRSGDNFHRMFGFNDRSVDGDELGFGGMMGRGGMMGFSPDGFTSAYGATGTIVKVSLPTIIVSGTDKVEKVVLINDKTIIREFRDDLKGTDLKEGDEVVIMGAPDNKGQIEARLIRIFPVGSVRATATSTNRN